MHQTKVVAISGASGCGKTTIVKKLAARFDCPALYFDDYVEQSTYPKNMKSWLNDGANLSAIKTPTFINAIQKLLDQGKSDYIFIEEPFGKEREPMRDLVNYVVLLDQPLEICLARVVNRSINNPLADSLTLLPKYLANYQDHFRDCYLQAVNQVRHNCDLIIEDSLSVDATTSFIGNWLFSDIMPAQVNTFD